jgi:hypothetical protein
MNRILNILIVFFFFIWILPLGAFFAPAQEKIACHGQRAICLCSHRVAKNEDKVVAQALTKGPSGTHKEEGASNADHSLFVLPRDFSSDKSAAFFFSQQQTCYSLLAVCRVEHIPKV